MLKLTKHHGDLLDIVFERAQTYALNHGDEIPFTKIDDWALKLMSHLVKIEFRSSLQNEIDNSEESDGSKSEFAPNPFDVFLVEPSFLNKNIQVAVVVPLVTKKKENVFLWYDKNNTLWNLHELIPTRKVSSLSGTARVLENLENFENDLIPKELMKQAMNRTNIFDALSIQDDENESFTIDGLNESQTLAVSAVTSKYFNTGFFVVQGPPGTGKSTTLVKMICSTHQQRVIASAPSNTAIANIALKLFETSMFHHQQLCVYGNNCHESVRFLNPTFRRERYIDFLGKKKEEHDEEKIEAMLHRFCIWLHIPPDSTFDDVKNICLSQEEDSLTTANIICCTLNSSGSAWLRKYCGYRETFFLDEAGQCNEAEFYLATTFPWICKIVVVGDPKQLPPTVIHEGCKKAGFGTSWMEKIHCLYPSKVHLLDTQYRMDPAILKFPNCEYYNGRIKSGENVHSRFPNIVRPIAFIDTSNRSREERENFSTRNSLEASIIRALIRQDDDIQTLLNEPEVNLIVITPYAAQERLLRNELRKVKGLCDWSVSTVDSFQGQEADIIIISTVRTDKIGFVDDPQRLNVALTRAKRILRIVGCKNLFNKLGTKSGLQRLTSYLCDAKYTVDAKVRNNAYSLPDWRKNSIWHPTMTQRFLHTLKDMDFKNRAVTLNTLQAVVIPTLSVLRHKPSENCWQISSLRGHTNCSIVWIAKQHTTIESHYVGVVEAHYAGSWEACHTFMQKNVTNIPRGACHVQKDMLSVRDQIQSTSRVTTSWDLSNFLQRAIESDAIEELPEGSFRLDPEQQAIASACPPLLVESRSGTGKTNVLFQHALSLSQKFFDNMVCMPIAFITVSKLLKTQLENMYADVKNINKAALHSCVFMSLSDLLNGLSKRMDLNMDTSDAISFEDYISEKKSHTCLKIDIALVENEIGGVILGSLRSAELKRPLTWEEYQENQRSNITMDGNASTTRSIIFNQYQFYEKWKRANNHFDINDMVLKILEKLFETENANRQAFAAVYLDEIQDFSYAMIYLICSIGGTTSLNWIFAGDTAQMISPGCSFKFSGLKQTLLSIQPGIESRLKKVSQLLTNYRTTRDILQLGNSILAVAKKHYPGAIEFARKEEAVNDYGLKVVVCDWNAALRTKPSFGRDQALVYSFSNEYQESHTELKHWLGDHPFFLSTLESKGLEFDDVVIAFELDRAYWKVELAESSGLNMLRHLYVAVTRAKRRVVILVKKKCYTMMKFLSNLEYNIEIHSNAKDLFGEFNTFTSTEQWLQRAKGLFDEERYDVAASCFEKAEEPASAAWARGKYFAQDRKKMKARQQFCHASKLLYEAQKYKMVLDVAKDMLGVVSWTAKVPEFICEEYLTVSCVAHPTYLCHSDIRKIDIFLDKWTSISLEDIEVEKGYVNKRRGSTGLVEFMKTFSEGLSVADLERATTVIPCIIGDAFCASKKYMKAIELYLKGGDYLKAEKTSEQSIALSKRKSSSNELLNLARLWLPFEDQISSKILNMLLLLFKNPKEASNRFLQYVEQLGPHTIKVFVAHKGLDPTHLYEFCKDTFHIDVLKELKRINKNNPENIYKWFFSHGGQKHAMDFIVERFALWNSEEVLNIMHFLHQHKKLELIPNWMSVLVALYFHPEKMNRSDCEECMKSFGPAVIRQFVLRRTSYTGKSKNNKDEYMDIHAVLGKFGTNAQLSCRAVLEYFHKKRVIKHAEMYIEFHIKECTAEDLFTVVDKFEYRSINLALEFAHRKLYVKALELYLALESFENAIKISEEVLSKPALAAKNAFGVRKLWLTENNESRYKCTKSLDKCKSPLGIFLFMCQTPEEVITSKSANKETPLTSICASHFGIGVIYNTILTSYTINPDEFSMDLSTILQEFIHQNVRKIRRDNFEFSKEAVLRDLKTMSEKAPFNKKALRSYLNKNISYWKDNTSNLNQKDIQILGSILEDLKMYSELVVLIQQHLKRSSLPNAIIYSKLVFEQKDFQEQKDSLIRVWAHFIPKIKNEDIHLLFDLNVLHTKVRIVLEERKMYTELVQLNLQGGFIVDAVTCSNKANIAATDPLQTSSLSSIWSKFIDEVRTEDIHLLLHLDAVPERFGHLLVKHKMYTELVKLIQNNIREGNLTMAVVWSNVALEKEDFQVNAQSLMELWSCKMDGMRNDEIVILLDLLVHPADLENILEKRKMYIELLMVYLKKGSASDAVQCSNLALKDKDSQIGVQSMKQFWSRSMHGMKNEDILQLLNLDVLPTDIGFILQDRKMFTALVDLIKIYLDRGFVSDAVVCSNFFAEKSKYINAIHTVWVKNFEKFSNEQMHLLLDLGVIPVELFSVLEQRKMYIELAKLHIHKGSIADAVKFSNIIFGNDDFGGHVEDLLSTWENIMEKLESNDIHALLNLVCLPNGIAILLKERKMYSQLIHLVQVHLYKGSIKEAVACSNIAFDDASFQSIGESLLNVWSDGIGNVKHEEIHHLLKLNVLPGDVESKIREHRMYPELLERHIRRGFIANAVSCSNFAFGDKDFQKHLDLIANIWSDSMHKIHNKDMHFFLGLNNILEVVEAEFFVRKLYTELVELVQIYLNRDLLEKAITCSNKILEGRLLYEDMLYLVDVWERPKYFGKISKESKLSLLLTLFDDPISASTSEVKSDYVSTFGSKIVECAVRRKTTKSKIGETLRAFDTEVFGQETKKSKKPKGKRKSKQQ